MKNSIIQKFINNNIICGVLIGTLAFGLLYGYSTLDVTYDGWIYHSYADESDVIQHYAGWVNYRNSPWQFPLGKAGILGNYSEQAGTTISFTDSIPLVAIICKLFAPLLPNIFQYFGWYVYICFILQAISALMLLELFTEDKRIALLFTLLFVFSPPLIERAFRHCALASHWLLLFTLYLFFRIRKENYRRLYYKEFALLSVLAMVIHPYFLLMILGIIVILSMEALFKHKIPLYKLIGFCMASIITALSAGYLIGAVGTNNPVAQSGGYGYFSLNLNALVNPYSKGYENWSILFPVLKCTLGNYESFNFLGAGIIIACSIIFIYSIIKIKHFRYFINLLINNIFLIVGIFCFTLFAVTNVITFQDKVILEYGIPNKILKFWYCIFGRKSAL
ncbi:DUF6311 domain-containing protein [Eisenbergiella tayi]|uniref:DUF6311 domain-containing protein n=1 Tax=Eisenbergiella tayi TaxID=1432052 RepID=UPI00084927A4|nr:DUF6311 domain-containing protein [Eisenbergiella tayi]ODR36047.1 hypothetical protein BEI60_15590 [Eisenbergiella tayi]